MAPVSANITEDERERLRILAIIRRKSGRELAGDAIRQLLGAYSSEIDAGIKAVGKPVMDKTHVKRKAA